MNALRDLIAALPLPSDSPELAAHATLAGEVASQRTSAEKPGQAARDADELAALQARFFAARLSAGFPRRALEAADRADPSTDAMRKAAAWRQRGGDLLVLSGKAGCGKTVAATWLASELAPYRARFGCATEFATSSRYHEEARERWFSAECLVLDDLGMEYADNKGSFVGDLDALINAYYADRRKLIITTNCTASDFKTRYGERIADRVREAGEFIWCGGESLRRRT